MAKKTPVMIASLTTMKQPNKVTYASYDYTIVQQKVFTYIMLQLQDYINQLVVNKGLTVNQLSLFKDSSKIEIPLKLQVFGNAANYQFVIDSVRLMASTLISFPEKRGANGIVYEREGHLISNILYPKKEYKKEIIVVIDKDVATDILNVQNGYTRFAYEIAFNSKNKYTPRIYQLICRWRDTGGFRLKYQDLRKMLHIPDTKYKEWYDFKKRVIKDVQTELIGRADVWFEVEIEKGEDGQYLNFKVITSDQMIILNKKKDKIMEVLKYHFGYADNDYNAISIYLLKPHIFTDLYNKLIELNDFIKSNKDINNIPAYVNAAIIKDFKARIK